MKKLLLPIAILSLPVVARAAELRALPSEVTLSGPRASQRILVVRTDGGKVVGQADAWFRSDDEKVATVDGKSGLITAAGDGETVVQGWHDGVAAKVKVTVKGFKTEADWGFRNHVVPVLTRVGCNSGACHGALAGKGGLKLSLRGYDPESDHFVLTRQALGRRVDRQEPARSLMLTKPTFAVKHGG